MDFVKTFFNSFGITPQITSPKRFEVKGTNTIVTFSPMNDDDAGLINCRITQKAEGFEQLNFYVKSTGELDLKNPPTIGNEEYIIPDEFWWESQEIFEYVTSYYQQELTH